MLEHCTAHYVKCDKCGKTTHIEIDEEVISKYAQAHGWIVVEENGYPISLCPECAAKQN